MGFHNSVYLLLIGSASIDGLLMYCIVSVHLLINVEQGVELLHTSQFLEHGISFDMSHKLPYQNLKLFGHCCGHNLSTRISLHALDLHKSFFNRIQPCCITGWIFF